MTNRQLPDFLTAENDLDGQEPVYIAQGGKTRKTLLSKIKEFIIGTTELTTTDKSISGAIEEVKEIADNNTTQLKDLANPNLLINGGFQVTQRGTTFSTINSKYTLDRWCFNQYATGSVEKVSNGVKLTSTSEYFWMTQYFEEDLKAYLLGKTITCSLMLSSGRKIVLTGVAGNNLTTNWIENVALVFTDTLEYQIRVKNGNVATVVYVKLELGSKATQFIPRLYGEELALCRRYGIGFKNERPRFRADAVNGNQLIFFIPLTTMLRISPTTDCFTINSLNGSEIEGFTFTVVNCPNGIIVNANKTSHGMSDGQLMIKDNAFIDSEIY